MWPVFRPAGSSRGFGVCQFAGQACAEQGNAAVFPVRRGQQPLPAGGGEAPRRGQPPAAMSSATSCAGAMATPSPAMAASSR
jgi:hypothetical protein